MPNTKAGVTGFLFAATFFSRRIEHQLTDVLPMNEAVIYLKGT